MPGCNSVDPLLLRGVCSCAALMLLACGSEPQSSAARLPQSSPRRATTSIMRQQSGPARSANSKALASAQMLEMPLRFERNDGQFAPSVRYLAHAQGLGVALDQQGATFLLGPSSEQRSSGDGSAPRTAAAPRSRAAIDEQKTATLRMQVRGARRNVMPEPAGELLTRSNYFIGRDRSRWRKHVPNYASVRYRDTLPGVDLVYHGDGRKLEYDPVVAPGAQPSTLAIEYRGAKSVAVNAAGELEIRIADRTLVQHKPIAYQELAGERRAVAASFRRVSTTSAGFSIGDYDRSQPLVIDPVIVFASYFGGSDSDQITAAAVGPENSVVIAGFTSSSV